jgi:hypothetical protein
VYGSAEPENNGRPEDVTARIESVDAVNPYVSHQAFERMTENRQAVSH